MRVIPPLPFTLPWALPFWAVYVWAFFPESRIIRAARRSAAARGPRFRVLGQWFTGAVDVRADQPVVTAGACRWIRHPSYTAGGLLWVGIGVALGNWVSLLVLTLTAVVGYGYRVRAEERALIATIGGPYRAYMARTRRFIPFLF